MPQAAAAEIFVERAGPRMDSSTRIEGRSIGDWRADARTYLQLPDAPVFAAGHQAQAWHCGIIAKTLWTDARARQENATPVHVVVDQDGFDGLFLEWPQLKDGFWVASGHRFSDAAKNVAALNAPRFHAREIEQVGHAPEFAREGLARLTQALRAFAQAPNAAIQVSQAQLQDLGHLIQPPRVIGASQLIGTSFAQHLIDRMLREPVECAESFNIALQLHPRAARPLRVDGERSELPLWLLGDSGERIRATAQNIRVARAQNKIMLPRAFLLGVLLRTALADGFTHGLGGKIYEEVSNAWIGRWLGWNPPAFDTVSATMRLPLELPTQQTQDQAKYSFRSIWCDPDLHANANVGPSVNRKKFLQDIAALPRRSPQRKIIFQAMLANRASRRAELASTLTLLQNDSRILQQAEHSKQLAMRRTWCACLYPREALDNLHQQLAHAANANTHSP